MTDDKTEFQTDLPQVPGVPLPLAGPSKKWFFQRLMAMLAFVCICFWPLVLTLNPDLDSVSIPWFTAHCSIIMTWFGGSTISAWKR
jgi:hypothetical protein